MKGKTIMVLFILFMLIFAFVFTANAQFKKSVAKATQRFETYKNMSKTIQTSYGNLSFIDKGDGIPILSFHGICGGYDQAYDTVADKQDMFRIVAPSRFGYPGSDMPEDPSIENQVKAFVELLDYLSIDKAFLIATSAGSAYAIKFALLYPERTKGLILYCSGYPASEKPKKTLKYAGPPEFLCNDFTMWFFSPLFGPIMGMDKNTIDIIMPLSPRKEGIVLDAKLANTDMENNYSVYDMGKLQVPVLMLHSKDDKLADYKKAEYWAQRIPDCHFVLFETGGHLMTGHSNEINKAFTEFTMP